MFFSVIELVLLSGLIVFLSLQAAYLHGYLGRPVRYYRGIKKGKISLNSATPPVSVIICAQNESENLAKFLPAILEQDYPVYEVIVVNEGSSDTSEFVLGGLEAKYKHLYHTYIPREAKNLSKKKLAITLGIKAAKYDTLLFTEADCVPSSKSWIRSMVRHFDDKTEIVLGYGAFPPGKSLMGKLAVFDNLINGLQYLSSALKQKTYMGEGRNLAYKKELFHKGNGFQTYLQLHAGEDDLFINENATEENVRVEISESSITTMDFCDFRFWKEMKVKRLATSHYYKLSLGLFRRWEGLLSLLFWAFAIACIVVGILYFPKLSSLILLVTATLAILGRWISQAIVLNKAAKILQKGAGFYWTIPLFDILLPCFNLYFRMYHTFKGKSDYIWKI